MIAIISSDNSTWTIFYPLCKKSQLIRKNKDTIWPLLSINHKYVIIGLEYCKNHSVHNSLFLLFMPLIPLNLFCYFVFVFFFLPHCNNSFGNFKAISSGAHVKGWRVSVLQQCKITIDHKICHGIMQSTTKQIEALFSKDKNAMECITSSSYFLCCLPKWDSLLAYFKVIG